MDKWKPLQKLGTFITKPWNPRKGDYYPNHSMSPPNPSHLWKQYIGKLRTLRRGTRKRLSIWLKMGAKNDWKIKQKMHLLALNLITPLNETINEEPQFELVI
jgi:hypothetical protein